MALPWPGLSQVSGLRLAQDHIDLVRMVIQGGHTATHSALKTAGVTALKTLFLIIHYCAPWGTELYIAAPGLNPYA